MFWCVSKALWRSRTGSRHTSGTEAKADLKAEEYTAVSNDIMNAMSSGTSQKERQTPTIKEPQPQH